METSPGEARRSKPSTSGLIANTNQPAVRSGGLTHHNMTIRKSITILVQLARKEAADPQLVLPLGGEEVLP